MAHDALGAHARDELGITDLSIARPLQAAGASAASFACGALLPLVVACAHVRSPTRSGPCRRRRSSSSRRSAPSPRARAAPRSASAAARVTFWGALAMAATAGIGELFGTIVQYRSVRATQGD